MTDRTLLQQALEALLRVRPDATRWLQPLPNTDALIDAIRARLAGPVQCNDNDSPWLICKKCHEAGRCEREPDDTEALAVWTTKECQNCGEAGMTALEYLRRVRCAEASEIIEATRQPLESVYADLVAAEARGEARVVVRHSAGLRWCEWEAT